MSTDREHGFPVISFTRWLVQLFSFIAINYIALEIAFNWNLRTVGETIKVFPFIHTPRDAWSTGAGILEYIFYALAHGEMPFLLLGLFILTILFTGRFFCGWICPVGFIQDLLSLFVKRVRRMSIETDKSLKKVKLWIFVLLLILTGSLGVLRHIDYNMYLEFDATYGGFLLKPMAGFSLSEFLFKTLPDIASSVWENMNLEALTSDGWRFAGFIFYIIVLAVSVYYPRFYCRVLCPYGGGAAFFGEYTLLRFARNPVKCVGRRECGICEKVCPMQIRILDEHYEGFTGRGECILCGQCREACPYDAIYIKFG